MTKPRLFFALGLLLGTCLAAAGPGSADPAEDRERAAGEPTRAVVLLTLDTTRADYLGAYGKKPSPTPHLDALASRGTIYQTAIAASPLTLPSHASLLTGLAPPEHGLRDNGLAALPAGIPTLATAFQARDWATAAFVSSRVLDRRFGLDRGFEVYDDHMPAEIVGEYGYAERDAKAVTEAALGWLERQDGESSFFLWVHYYDPHSPYRPPGVSGGDETTRYAGEIAFVDQQIGRLLAALPARDGGTIVAAVADHGEALGSHGERTHGLFLYRPVVEVPLILAGPGVPRGVTVRGTVPSRHLAPTLLRLGGGELETLPGPALPGLFQDTDNSSGFAYSETWLPATAYGWSAIRAMTGKRYKLIVAPRPELYDLAEDPGETRNLVRERPREARRLKAQLESFEASLEPAAAETLAADAELQASLRSLGYLSGASGSRSGTLDPKDGLALLESFEAAKIALSRGETAEAIRRLRELVRKNPGNVPFLTNLGTALLAGGEPREGVEVLRRAAEQNPRLDFLHLRLAEALDRIGEPAEAKREYELALELNPRLAGAWLGLAEMAHRSGQPEEELRVLRQGVEAETDSAALHLRLGQLLETQEPAAAAPHFEAATDLMPTWTLAWLMRGQAFLRRGETAEGRQALEKILNLAPRSAEGREAARLLKAIQP